MPCHPYALSRGGTFCNIHITQSTQPQYKTNVQNKYWVFLEFIFRIASVQKIKKMVQITCMYRENRTNLPCDVYQGLKCGPFEQDYTNFGWIFAVQILGLEGERVSKK